MATSSLCSQVMSLALLFNIEHWMHRQGKEQSLLQETTNGIIDLINELGSVHQNRTVCT